MADLKLVPALFNKVLHPFKELVVVISAEKVTTGKDKVLIKQYFANVLSFQNANSSGFLYLESLPITDIIIQIQTQQ